jgi:hypothetical protein
MTLVLYFHLVGLLRVKHGMIIEYQKKHATRLNYVRFKELKCWQVGELRENRIKPPYISLMNHTTI